MSDRSYAWESLPALSAHIERHQRDQALEELNRLLEIFGQTHPTLDLRKIRCVQTMSHCIRAAREAGVSSQLLIEEHYRALDDIVLLKSWKAVCRFMFDYCEGLLAHVQKIQFTSLEKSVLWIRRDMKEHLSQPKTLAQYAKLIGLSREHLSRSFQKIAGRSFRHELGHIKIKRACRLLRETNMKIRVIAEEVGFPSASQFILMFKQHTKMTPGEYRKRKSR